MKIVVRYSFDHRVVIGNLVNFYKKKNGTAKMIMKVTDSLQINNRLPDDCMGESVEDATGLAVEDTAGDATGLALKEATGRGVGTPACASKICLR